MILFILIMWCSLYIYIKRCMNMVRSLYCEMVNTIVVLVDGPTSMRHAVVVVGSALVGLSAAKCLN